MGAPVILTRRGKRVRALGWLLLGVASVLALWWLLAVWPHMLTPQSDFDAVNDTRVRPVGYGAEYRTFDAADQNGSDATVFFAVTLGFLIWHWGMSITDNYFRDKRGHVIKYRGQELKTLHIHRTI